jgi:hypothetical protein
VRRVISWGAFAAVLLALYVVAGPAHLGGPASYVIVYGISMEPTYQHGDLVVARTSEAYEVDLAVASQAESWAVGWLVLWTVASLSTETDCPAESAKVASRSRNRLGGTSTRSPSTQTRTGPSKPI